MYNFTKIQDLIEQERKRQVNEICLIASENYTSKAVMEAVGSVLTNKYSEGYPNKRYYGGCKYVDMIEQYAIESLNLLNAYFPFPERKIITHTLFNNNDWVNCVDDNTYKSKIVYKQDEKEHE